jgi:thioredoxin reductase (NADPH)
MGKNYDVIILGSGPSGITAGIYAARYGLKVAIIAKEIGGTANYAVSVENYPSFFGSGMELMKSFSEQAKKLGVEILQREIVIIKKEKEFVVQTSRNEEFRSSSMIICLGTEKKKLNIFGEDAFLGKGVSYCATCDGAFFKGKTVAVVGGRNSAAQSALMLGIHAKKVYVIYRQELLNCDDVLLAKIKNSKNIDIIYESEPLKIIGKESVTDLIYRKSGKEESIKVEGVFVEIGSAPASSLVKGLGVNIDDSGYIIVDKEMKTNIEGVFASGDITAMPLRQILTASANGAIAAFSTYKFLKEGKKS